jgi:hypothetical protein
VQQHWTALIGDYEKAPQHRLCKNDQRLKNIRSSVRDTEQAVALHYALMNDPLRRVAKDEMYRGDVDFA